MKYSLLYITSNEIIESKKYKKDEIEILPVVVVGISDIFHPCNHLVYILSEISLMPTTTNG